MSEAQVSGGWLLFQGILFILFGMFAIGAPYVVTLSLGLLMGWMLLIIGGISIVQAIMRGSEGGGFLEALIGIITAILGVLMLTQPLGAALTVSALVVMYLIVDGCFRIALSMQLPRGPVASSAMLSGILSLLIAVPLIIGWPTTAVWFVGVAFGISLIFSGVNSIAYSFYLKKVA